MAVSPLFRPIALAAGISSVAQATMWTLLAFLGILAHGGVIKTSISAARQSPASNFQLLITSLYFNDDIGLKDECKPDGELLDRDGVIVIVCMYFTVNIIWLVTSAIQLNNIVKEDVKYTRNILLVWSGITSAVVLLDFSVTICFARDYDTLLNLPPEDIAKGHCSVLPLVPALLMSLSARGFLLWFLNVAFLVYLLMAALQLSSEKRGYRASQMPSISALYQPPTMDSLPQENRGMGFQPAGEGGANSIPPAAYVYVSASDASAGPSSNSNWKDPPRPEPQSSQPMDYPRGGPGPSTSDWAQQSSQVGDQPRGPWSYTPDRRPAPLPPASMPVRGPQAPYHSSIPDPDYDEGPYPERSKYEPRPYNEQPQRSALKKEHGRPGRSVF